ncbi:Glutathione S-transferase [Mycena kentingensis (nom. inval.)]|nr:Glutathione S-transferase [Mycena kentingensis (nom. inval.)]
MVLKLYSGTVAGGGAGVVALVLREKEIPFQQVLVELSNKEHKTPEHLARHPFGQIPVIDDNGFVVYETRAICRYLAEKYPSKGPKLLPGASLEERTVFEQACSVEHDNFHPNVLKLFAEVFVKPRQGLEADKTVVETVLTDFGTRLDVYEQILAKQEYLTGHDLSLVDFFHLTIMPAVEAAGIDIMMSETRPSVKRQFSRWWTALTSRPLWVELRADGIKSTA